MSDKPRNSVNRVDANQQENITRHIVDDVITRLRKRFWFAALIVGVLGYFGVKEIVRGVTEAEIRAAQRAAIVAEESAKRTTAITDEATVRAETYSKVVETLQTEATKVQQQFLAVKNQLEADRANLKAGADQSALELKARIARLDELVAKLAQDSQSSRQALDTYRSELQKFTARADAERQRFTENSRYSVVIYSTKVHGDLATRAQQRLSELGFRTSVTSVLELQLNVAFNQPKVLSDPVPTVNTLFYVSGREQKANEVKDALTSLVRIAAMKEVATGREAQGKGFWAAYATLVETAANQMWLVLPEK